MAQRTRIKRGGRKRRRNRNRSKRSRRNRKSRRRGRRRRGGGLAATTLGVLKTALVPYFLYEAQRRMKKRVHSRKKRRH